MKYYIASSFANKEIVNQTINSLNNLGFINTYNWTLNEKADNKLKLKTIGIEELNAVKDADILIAILPGGKGTHIEMGIAIGCNKPVLIAYFNKELISVDNSATFYHLDKVKHILVTKENIVDKLVKTLREN
ncbi:nucleoside 2-deoxyribosyltransferase [Macrococcus epidermidis]|uniref:nucleoside 2-deoxyribosyltransferase n=1 Tax=Macrococcus epidermidis TaxID=1902580 RepID=UPI0020B69732|nr:nucleoside 2-deoxyribosyltransferase [Macrococcus epidermidis]UTH15073.1 nucleoside 2-deoxyribosyltransferase [Macrococcus epidermidis]